MSSSQPAPRTRLRTRPTILFTALVVVAALLGAMGCRLLTDSSSSASAVAEPSALASLESLRGDVLGAPDSPRGDRHGALGVADGELPEGVTIFDDGYPAVAKLDPDLLGALRTAATDAADDGVELYVNSGWRSAAYQAQLFREAVSEYGSEEVAARWVATAQTSAHVSGDAIDIGPSDAASWLSEHGAAYGLCQIYDNEPWHYELRPDAVDDGCPATYPDPTHDPRMQP